MVVENMSSSISHNSHALLGLDHGVGHCVEMTSQEGLQQGRSLAIFSHDIHA